MDWDKETGTVEFVKFDPKDGHYQNSKRRFAMVVASTHEAA